MKNTNAFTMIATKTDTFIQKKPQNGFKLLTNNCKTTLKHITKNENNKLVHKKHAGHFQMLSSATVQRKQSKSSFSMLYCHKNKSMLQPMFLNDFANEFLNPQFEDEPVQDNSQQFKEQIRSMTFQDTYDTDGVVTDEFVQNHVVEDDLLNKSEIVAKSRQKPVSTTILFTSADKRNLVREIRTRNLNGYFSTQMSQRNNVVTSNDKYLFVEWVKKGSKYKLGRVGFGKIRYGFRSTRIIGGTMYFLTHLDRMVDVETTVQEIRMFQFLNNSTKQNSPLQKKTTIFSMIPSEKRPVQKKVQPQFTMIAGCGADHQPLQMLSKKCVSQNSFQMLSTNTMIQTKKKRKKNKRRQKAIAYQDRLEQRLHDKLIGSSLRQILDVKNPLHNPAYKSSSIATLADMEPEDRVAWTKSLQASVHSVLDDYVPVPLPTDSHGAYNALTTFNGVKKEMQVRYDPDVVTYRNRDVRIGRLTATFTHEIAVHGLDGNPDEEHHQMASPADRDKYLEAVHNAFNSLDNTRQKTAFVNEWRQDMFNQIAWDDTIHNPEKRQRRRWVQAQYDEMIAAIESPQRYRWAI